MTLSFYYAGSNVVISNGAGMWYTYQISWSDCLFVVPWRKLRSLATHVYLPRNISFLQLNGRGLNSGTYCKRLHRVFIVSKSDDTHTYNWSWKENGISHRWRIQLLQRFLLERKMCVMFQAPGFNSQKFSLFSKGLEFVWNSESSLYWASSHTATSKGPIKMGLVYNNDEWLWAITMKTIYGSLHRSSVCVSARVCECVCVCVWGGGGCHHA